MWGAGLRSTPRKFAAKMVQNGGGFEIHCTEMERAKGLGREFGDSFNFVEIRLSEANCGGGDHVVHLLGLARANDRSGDGWVAQSPGDRDCTRETIVAFADRA